MDSHWFARGWGDVASYVTAPQAAGHKETMTISREATDIAWAIAYVPPGLGVFGRLDNRRFGIVPRPVLNSAWRMESPC